MTSPGDPPAVPGLLYRVLRGLATEAVVEVRMDLHMLALLNGRERTVAEYATLLADAGLRLTADVRTSAGVHMLETRPA